MKSSLDPAVRALLTSTSEVCIADGFCFIRPDGTVYACTNAPSDIIGLYGSGSPFVWYAENSPIIKRGRTSCRIGLEVDQMSLDITSGPTTDTSFTNGLSWMQAALQGLLDGTVVLVRRFFFPDWTMPLVSRSPADNGVSIFSGQLGPIHINGFTLETQVNSNVQVLNQPFPRNVYQPPCVRNLYDSGCTLNRASYTVNATVFLYFFSSKFVVWTTATNPVDTFRAGTIRFLDGPNAGIVRTIKRNDTVGAMSLSNPLPHEPIGGENVELTFGCDKKQATCSGKFSNQNNFRGWPYIPVAETAY